MLTPTKINEIIENYIDNPNISDEEFEKLYLMYTEKFSIIDFEQLSTNRF